MSERLLLGLAGDPGSGKSAGAEYLTAVHAFSAFMGSAFLKQLAAIQGVELRQRVDYGNFQRRLRLERSQSFATDAMLNMPGNRIVNNGIRNRFDVQRLQEAGGLVVAFACPIIIRYERTRGTDDKYPDILEDFIAAEAQEYDDPDPFGQHTHWAMENADYTVDSSRPLAEVHKELDKIVTAHSY